MKIAIGFTAMLLAASALCLGQEHVYRFANLRTTQQMQESLTILRTVLDMSRVSADLNTATISYSGTPEQEKAAEWILRELDEPNAPTAVAYGESLRMMPLEGAATPQDVQETLTVLRTVLDIPRIFPLSSRNLLVASGDASQLEQADWLVRQFASPKPGQMVEYPGTSEIGPRTQGYVLRVLFPVEKTTATAMQQQQVAFRVVAGISRVFLRSNPKAFALRGPKDQLDAAEWLLRNLDRPAGSGKTAELPFPGSNVLLTVAFLPKGANGPQIFETARNQVNSKAVVYCADAAALVARGSAAEIATVQQIARNQQP